MSSIPKARRRRKPAPAPDQTDITNWLAKWANLTAMLGFAADEASELTCAVRPDSVFFKASLAPLVIDRGRMDRINEAITIARHMVSPVPFVGVVGPIGGAA